MDTQNFNAETGKWTYSELRIPWPVGMEPDEWLKRGGFRPYSPLRFGSKHFFRVEIYGSGETDRYVALVRPFDDTLCVVYIDDLPTLLNFIKEYAAPLSGQLLQNDVAELKEGFNKLFRIWHGHDMDLPCWECDKPEMQRMQNVFEMRLTEELGEEEKGDFDRI